MPIIALLTPLEAQKIAAGEVVERPATIVKELLENSLDAGATSITLTLDRGGKERIVIQDNGSGMDEIDAQLCFARHATSKITSVDELMSLETFGFRGEALASISAIGHVTLETRTEQSSLGISVTAHGLTVSAPTPLATPVGTKITVEELFESVPARKKFLKLDETEYNQCEQIYTAYALTQLHCAFTLYKDGTKVSTLPAGQTLQERIGALWGHQLARDMYRLTQGEESLDRHDSLANEPLRPSRKRPIISVSGYITTPSVWRYNRQQLLFFVNGRFVKNSELGRAVIAGYKHSLASGKYPAGVLMITVSSTELDVNIHPRKDEVRFSHPRIVTDAITAAVLQTLECATTAQLQPRITTGYPQAQQPPAPIIALEHSPHQSAENRSTLAGSLATGERALHKTSVQHAATDAERANLENSLTAEKNSPFAAFMGLTSANLTRPEAHASPIQHVLFETPATAKHQSKTHVIGQLLKTYILIENEDGLAIIDQHAAHERILYHRYTGMFSEKVSTQLLFPPILSLSASAVTRILAHRELLAVQGITCEQGGPAQLIVTGTPPALHAEDLRELFSEIDELLSTHEGTAETELRIILNEHVHSHTACKKAVKAGDSLTRSEMEQLVADLLETPDRFMCIHGRPTTWSVTQHELEKKFRRK